MHHLWRETKDLNHMRTPFILFFLSLSLSLDLSLSPSLFLTLSLTHTHTHAHTHAHVHIHVHVHICTSFWGNAVSVKCVTCAARRRTSASALSFSPRNSDWSISAVRKSSESSCRWVCSPLMLMLRTRRTSSSGSNFSQFRYAVILNSVLRSMLTFKMVCVRHRCSCFARTVLHPVVVISHNSGMQLFCTVYCWLFKWGVFAMDAHASHAPCFAHWQ